MAPKTPADHLSPADERPAPTITVDGHEITLMKRPEVVMFSVGTVRRMRSMDEGEFIAYLLETLISPDDLDALDEVDARELMAEITGGLDAGE